MAKDYDKDQLLADWKAGGYSQRDLADKYDLSRGMIAKLTKGVSKELKGSVDRVIAALQKETVSKSEQEVSAITKEVCEKSQYLEFIHNATLKNMSVMIDKVDDLTTHQEHKFIQDTLHKGGESLGVIDKAGVVINNTNAQQNNTKLNQEIYDRVMSE